MEMNIRWRFRFVQYKAKQIEQLNSSFEAAGDGRNLTTGISEMIAILIGVRVEKNGIFYESH